MRIDRLRQALQAASLSAFERQTLQLGVWMLVGALVAVPVTGAIDGVARVLATTGLLLIALCAASRGVRGYRARLPAAIPSAVGRTRVRAHPRPMFTAATVTFALGLPVAAGAAVLILVAWAWPLVVWIVVVGCAATLTTWALAVDDYTYPSRPDEQAAELLARLSMLGDIPVPELVIEPGSMANAWTAAGRVHITSRTLELLDDAELEAVLAHELAHVAHRDAAVMEICSAPSRVLLGFSHLVGRRVGRWLFSLGHLSLTAAVGLALVAALCAPVALLLGWLSRLSVLGLSRAREFSADAAASALTGSPSALASALLKLERQREWAPLPDLRQFDADAVLCIVGKARAGIGRLLSTHPSTSARIKRLEELELRIQRPERA